MAKGYNLPARQFVSQDNSAIIAAADVPRSKFVGSWNRLTTFDAGDLTPILVEEVLPGDHINYNVTAYVRMSTPLFPIFTNQRVDTHFFFVPNRLVWDNWTRFMGEQATPTSTINFTVPKIELNIGHIGPNHWQSIWDYFGIPIGQIDAAGTIHVNALPFRAYMLIWNEWYRDQNMQDSWTVEKGDTDAAANYTILIRNKFHDYFTSALPWPQKFTAPTIPLGGLAPVIGLGVQTANIAGPLGGIRDMRGTGQSYPTYWQIGPDAGAFDAFIEGNAGGTAMQVWADLSVATGLAVNTFRQAYLVQQLLERDARGGTRYTELIFSHFKVRNPDFRLQRPEYIGGGSSPLQVTPVAATAEGSDYTVGDLGAAGTSVGNHRASFAATEHGYIIGIMSVRTELAYQQGIPRHFGRTTRYDFYWPSLAGLGEQAILRNEIYMRGTADDAIVFGYQERWHEYRSRHSEVTGAFRSTVTGTIDPWHLAQRFTSPPTLSNTFVRDKPPMARVLAAGEAAAGMQYLADILFQRTAVRPLPTFGTPATLGRF